jgi:hypothetical protein
MESGTEERAAAMPHIVTIQYTNGRTEEVPFSTPEGAAAHARSCRETAGIRSATAAFREAVEQLLSKPAR